MTFRPSKQRLWYYIFLAGLCCVVPNIISMAIILITGDRELGMSMFVIPSVVITHIVFAQFFLQTRLIVKYAISILIASVAILGLKFLLPLNILDNLFDIYGFWDITITHLFVAIAIWEITVQIFAGFEKIVPKQS